MEANVNFFLRERQVSESSDLKWSSREEALGSSPSPLHTHKRRKVRARVAVHVVELFPSVCTVLGSLPRHLLWGAGEMVPTNTKVLEA